MKLDSVIDFVAKLGAGHLIVEASWAFPHEEVPPVPDAADMERMVKREEILHTGKLKLKIIKASVRNRMSWVV